MAAPSEYRTFRPYPANALPSSFPSQYSDYTTAQWHASTPTSASTLTPASYEEQGELSPHVFGTYISPSSHDLPLFNTALHAHQFSLPKERCLDYQFGSSPPSSSSEANMDSSPAYTPDPPSSTPTTPDLQSSHHPHEVSNKQTWVNSKARRTSSAFAAYNETRPMGFLIPTSPNLTTSIQGGRGEHIGTPFTLPSPLYPYNFSPDLTTPTSSVLARFRNATTSPATPHYFENSSPVVISPIFDGNEFGGGEPLGLVPENQEASEEIRKLMADQKGTSTFPGSLARWTGFEGPPAIENQFTQGQGWNELVSPHNTSYHFESQETPLLAGTPSPLAAAFSPFTSPPLVQRTYSDANAYRHFVPPPGPSSPLPRAPLLPLPEPRYSEHYSINPHDANVMRAHQLLEAHMKNRWGNVLSANRALQGITGTSGMGGNGGVGFGAAPLETAATTLMHIQTGGPRPKPLHPGFSTPMSVMRRTQAEGKGRVRSLRSIYREYITQPQKRAAELCSLSIHAVSGSIASNSSPGLKDMKLRNELLGHFTAAKGGAILQLLEIDIANPTGTYNQDPFERWAFFVIGLPMVCGPGGADKGYVGEHERASMMIAAPLREVVTNNGKETQDVLSDGTACLRRDFVFGPGVTCRMEFWDKYSRWLDLGECAVLDEKAEWLSAELDEAPEGGMETWEQGGRPPQAVVDAVKKDVERWKRVKRAIEGCGEGQGKEGGAGGCGLGEEGGAPC
ncbi:hypothetical protein O988_09160 [Pseudogymnoascus sp. VKM F-3808]|nr:hypothetical protein O988_09160 [Pseudogymnoascus sp. VKM F-3808]